MRSRGSQEDGFLLTLIVWERTCKGTLLIAVGIGLLGLAHRNFGDVVTHLIRTLNLDVDRRSVQMFASRLDFLTGKTAIELSEAALLLGILDWIQAVGLYYKKRWAEVLTVASLAILIPFEVIHFWQRWNALRAIGVAINVLVVVYLFRRLRLGK